MLYNIGEIIKVKIYDEEFILSIIGKRKRDNNDYTYCCLIEHLEFTWPIFCTVRGNDFKRYHIHPKFKGQKFIFIYSHHIIEKYIKQICKICFSGKYKI